MDGLPVDAEVYRQFVESASTASADQPFFTRTAEQTALAVEYLFRRANEFVLILTDTLDPRVYSTPGISEAVTEFLNRISLEQREPVIFILHESSIDKTTHPFIQSIATREAHDGRKYLATLRVVPDAANPDRFGFVVADGKHYIFHSRKDDSVGMVQFGDADVGQRIQAVFTHLWTVSHERRRADAERLVPS